MNPYDNLRLLPEIILTITGVIVMLIDARSSSTSSSAASFWLQSCSRSILFLKTAIIRVSTMRWCPSAP